MPWHGIASLSPSVVTFGIIQYYIIISLLDVTTSDDGIQRSLVHPH